MNHPSREVNGSGRILYREIRMEQKYGYHQGYGCTPNLVRTDSPVMARTIDEWSKSGDYLCLGGFWHHRKEIELLEALP